MASKSERYSSAAALGLLLVFIVQAFAYPSVPEAYDPVGASVTSSFTAVVNVTVTDDVGRLLEGATVRVEETGNTVVTGEDGPAEFSGLFADNNATSVEYNLTATKLNYRGSSARINVTENDTSYLTIMIFGGSIAGYVTTLGPPAGPVMGAVVSSALGYSTTVVAEDGSYVLAGLPAGEHNVSAVAPGYVSQSKNVTVTLTPPVVTLSFVLQSQTGSISGFVFHNLTAEPIENASVSVKISEQVTVTVATGSDGSYNITNLQEGTYKVTASMEGFESSTNSNVSVVRETVTRNVNFSLDEKPTRLHGVIRSGTYLLAGVNISIAGTDRYNVSGPYGTYEILGLPAGTYTIVASPAGYQTAIITDVVLPPGGDVELNINLTGLPGAIVRGTVLTDGTTSGIAYVLVTIVDADLNQGDWSRSTTTNFKGQFEFTGLDAGNYTLRFEKVGFSPFETSKFAVTETTITNRTYELSPLREGFSGFFGEFDMAHSMMFLGVGLTLVIFFVALYLRIKTFMTPGSSPAVYDQAEEGEDGEPVEESGDILDDEQKRTRRLKKGGE
jgi:hypothetical protein